jgi:hypothetical protein
MKALKIAALLSILATGTAFAQSNPATNAPADNATTTQAVAPKTRAEVYGELVHAEKDGQLAYLNSTVYAHP